MTRSVLAAVTVVAAGIVAAGCSGGESGQAEGGLPHTPDYHSLLVAPDDPEALVLGTHDGLFRSSDGGRTWDPDALSGQDAMNLSRPTTSTLWAAGHDVLAQSVDGGATWTDVRPSGLPHLDVHGFAAHPSKPETLYAALAGTGLYRSTDGGRSFALVSRQVGGAVMALGVQPDGTLLAGDMQQGLLVSGDAGRTWRQALAVGAMGIALDPANPDRVLATGDGIYLSKDGGGSWEHVLELIEGAGPVAWASSGSDVAYAVGLDRTLWRSDDAGVSWGPVAP